MNNQPAAVTQLTLPFHRDERYLLSSLQSLTGRDIALTITDNRRSMLSARRRAGRIELRMHRIFIHAGDHVIKALADFIKGGRALRSDIREYIRDNHLPAPQRLRPGQLRTEGACHSLKQIFDRTNEEYFKGEVSASITWGRNSDRKRTRRVTLGSYCESSQTIRINPLLDRKTVPEYFLRFVVYHEMLHAVIATRKKNGRRSVHSAEFRQRERQFAEYDLATAWEKNRRFY